jgi:hypothetical protein
MEKNFKTQDNLKQLYGFTIADFDQIKEHGISLEKIETELLLFQSGITKIYLERPATVNDGIVKLSQEEFQMKADS